MTIGLAAALAAAVAIGLLLGLLGGGGSILAVPVLVYLAGVEPATAIAMSLFVVGATSLTAMLAHAKAGRVHWRIGLLFAPAGMAGAYMGGRLAAYVPEPVLLAGFAVTMVVAAVAMIGRKEPNGEPASEADPSAPSTRRRRAARVLAQGAVVGLLTGLVGAGGGFLVVPALALLGGLSMPAAVGTSLVIVAANAFSGLAGQLHATTVDWRLTLVMTALAIGGSIVGGRLCGRLDPTRLRRGFGWFIAAMGIALLAGQIGSA